MAIKKDWDIIIIGGGVAGLTAALHLSNEGREVCLIEKDQYPNHKVCGEYVSNEILPYLNSLGIDPFAIGAKKISKFEITDTKGTILKTELPLGGFGLSRYAFDNMLYQAIKDKVKVVFDRVQSIDFEQNKFKILTKNKLSFKSDLILGAYGKRSNLDSFLERKFMKRNSPWLAVKGHFEYNNFSDDKVSLHNFHGGYCGLSKTETGAVNACYLATFQSFKKHGDIEAFQKKELSKNPFLKDFFNTAKPIFKKPLTISQISFYKKSPVSNHIFMLGDSAGLIHPLCGNGMAMAIKSAKIFSELYLKASKKEILDRATLEMDYTLQWRAEFEERLKMGRFIQKLLLNPFTSQLGFTAAKNFPSLLPKIIERTHGSQPL